MSGRVQEQGAQRDGLAAFLAQELDRKGKKQASLLLLSLQAQTHPQTETFLIIFVCAGVVSIALECIHYLYLAFSLQPLTCLLLNGPI